MLSPGCWEDHDPTCTCSGSSLDLRVVGVGMAMSPGNGVRAGDSLACCTVVLLKRSEGQVWPGEPSSVWGHGLAQLVVSWGLLLRLVREAASQPGSWVQFLEYCQHEGWRVLSTVGPGKDLAGKHPGKEELLQEMVELSAVCQRHLTRLRPVFVTLNPHLLKSRQLNLQGNLLRPL